MTPNGAEDISNWLTGLMRIACFVRLQLFVYYSVRAGYAVGRTQRGLRGPRTPKEGVISGLGLIL